MICNIISDKSIKKPIRVIFFEPDLNNSMGAVKLVFDKRYIKIKPIKIIHIALTK